VHFSQDDLIHFQPKFEFFVGIDSDGCVFDSMEPKHKECFCPVFIEKWNLAAISKYAREAWEFVNLYSKDRGCNRFHALQKAFDLLRERPEVKRRGVQIPTLPVFKAWTERETRLGNPALTAEVERTGDAELKRVLDWSLAINEAVKRVVKEVPPFPLVRECLQKLHDRADTIVVSGTPAEALRRDWQEHDLDQYVSIIAGQEMGSKKQHLEFATKGKYATDHVLMIGDAPGDFKAAKANGALFFPINPGAEEESWELFYNEALDKFLAGQYSGAYESRLIEEFDRLLPIKPAWRTK